MSAVYYLTERIPDKRIANIAPQLQEAIKKHNDATRKLIDSIENNPKAFDRLLKKIFTQ